MAGFICREITAHGDYADGLASPVQGLFYSATPIFTIPLYIFLIRLFVTAPTPAWLRPQLYIIILTCFNSAVITCTAQGAATYFSPDQKDGAIKSGLALIKASLILQLFMNAAFIYILWVSRNQQQTRERTIATVVLLALMCLVIVRNLFRTVQIFASPLSQLWVKEVYFWIFEACIMLAFTTLFHVMHPAKILRISCGEDTSGRRDS
ncbi:uncharacterized protein A1O9_12994 [Exophiala aquamarina CBS 119918]|uniref:Uncharacterized protein n=1 Tax=Exophiala aquamarina CBS 119918 TaxID=1182545 RepID=A0A072P5R1_9EURO|nr:uncharacterized protein A1O9_12994 [Exophiala aquamarina CBS 119918]KEF50955.1 hypothetical protein A1O9_12994 [Exophiala aquamarina CBS 119918]